MADLDTSLQANYPGQDADARQILALADAYAEAADGLQKISRKGLAQAPFRLAAIHAIELYLNAVLRMQGHDAKDIRSLQHDLSKRLAAAKDAGLTLGARTAKHIDKLTETQEYLKARYAPNESANLSQLNRLQRTLEQVREKTLTFVARSKAPITPRKTSAGNG